MASSKGVDPETIDLNGILAGDFSSVGDVPDSLYTENNDANLSSFSADPRLLETVLALEQKVMKAVAAVQREEKIAQKEKVQKTISGLQEEVHDHVATLTLENHNLKEELRRVEAQNEQLLGYSVDHLTENELLALIGDLTSAVDRVRLTVQTKNIGMKTKDRSKRLIELASPEQRASGGRMSMEYMSKVIEDLKQHCLLTESRRSRRDIH